MRLLPRHYADAAIFGWPLLAIASASQLSRRDERPPYAMARFRHDFTMPLMMLPRR